MRGIFESTMTESQGADKGTGWLGVIAVLFGLLLLANQGTELLKQAVIVPGSAAEQGIAAACRLDELEEEGLSRQECELLVSSVQITLASSPDWFRPMQLGLSAFGCLAALLSLTVGFNLVNGKRLPNRWGVASFALLLAIDVAGFLAAVNTGPLLRAQYLWPLLLWFFIHLCLLIAMLSLVQQKYSESAA
jgi:hypothetical protein